MTSGVGELTCGACGATNRAGARFCSECGVPTATVCPGCGTAVFGGRFCSECGAPLSERTAAVPAQQGADRPSVEPVSERRTVSLLFADLVGFTPLTEARDPEIVRELQAVYFERARAVIERYNGTVEKFIGDAVFAVWGVPAAREDDAERAVRAGLDLVAMTTVMGEEFAIEGLSIRVGITTGQVAVTLAAVGEQRQGMVAGDAVNTASRVQSIAAPGQVWVDDTTRSLTTASLAYLSTGAHEMKGKTLPVELFRAVRTTAAVGGAQRVDGLEAPFVGRDRELRLVKELYHATAEERRARLVLVAGEPGIGKSRLAWEFEKYVDAITSRTYWLRGRCLSYGQGVAGRVVAEMVRSLLRVTEADDDATVAKALDERLQQHIPDETERAVLRPRLTSLLGLSDAVFDQADLFACWRAFFESLCIEPFSLTLVVEDLQWADDGFLDFLEHVLDVSRAPIMVLALARPEVSARRAGIGAGRRSTTVFLEPLPDAAMARLLDGLVADLPAALRAELVARAEGVPLYAVETVRALIDRDVVIASGGQYVLDPVAAKSLDLTALGPPASLQALLAARLDALPASERRVVQDASVLGLSFAKAGIAALAPSDIDLDAVLNALVRKEILVVDNDPRSPERGQYRFVQALLRSSAYDTLSRRDRYSRHLAVAEHLAGLPDADTIAGVLAAHYLDALAALPEAPDAPQLRERAAELLEQAAIHAAGVGAPRDALAHYDQLLQMELPDETLVRLTQVASTLAVEAADNLDRCLQWMEVGLAAVGRIGDEDALLNLELNHARLLANKGAIGDAMQICRRVFDAALANPERVGLLAGAARLLAVGTQTTGEHEFAEHVVMSALPVVERYGTDAHFASLIDGLAAWAGGAGYRRFSMVIGQGARLRTEGRESDAIVRDLNSVSLLVNDDPAAGIGLAAAALQRAEELGLVASRIVAIAHLVNGLFFAGRWQEAVDLLERHVNDGRTDRLAWEAYIAGGSALHAYGRADASLLLPVIEASGDLNDPLVEGWTLLNAGVARHLDGDRASGARLAADAAMAIMSLGKTSEDLPPVYALAVDMLLDADDRARLGELTAALEQVPLGQRFRLLHGQLLRARAQLSSDPVQVVRGLRAAVEVFTAMGAAYPAARTRVELAALLADDGDVRGATDLLANARPVLEKLGAVVPLAIADRVSLALTPVESI
ncbi:MAG TPA: adenylate/guanylate cyclase domain-containing protein [Acidothermaceae bacterium]